MKRVMTVLKTLGFVGALALISGCTDNGVKTDKKMATKAPQYLVATDIADIKQQARRFSQAYIDNDLDALLAIYAQDAVIGPPSSDFKSGAKLRSYWDLGPDVVVTKHKIIPADIIVEGNIAYDWGQYEGAAGPDGNPAAFSGKYLIVWRRGDDGIWLMVQDMWNSLPE